jgi:hypothetical protein
LKAAVTIAGVRRKSMRFLSMIRINENGGVRLCLDKLSTIDGPFTETKEVIGGFAIVEAASNVIRRPGRAACRWLCRQQPDRASLAACKLRCV